MFYLYSAWRIISLGIAYIADKVLPPSGNFQLSVKPIDTIFKLPAFIQNSGNFDGMHYLLIAKQGYGLYQQAFFPLYPALIHMFSFMTNGHYFLSGFILSNLSFFLGIYVFRKYLERIGKSPKDIVWITALLLVFPTSFFFGAVYTEGLFFFLVSSALLSLQGKKYGIAAVFCILASLTRLMGVFLFIPVFFTVVLEQQKMNVFWVKTKLTFNNVIQFILRYKKIFLLSLSPVGGLLMYMLYLFVTIHDSFAFYNAVGNFHTGRETKTLIFLPQVLYRYINIFVHAQHNYVYFVAVVEFCVFNLVFAVLLYDLWILWRRKNIENRLSLIGLNIFSLVNILMPTLTGTLTSVPRYALLSLSFFIRLAAVKHIAVKSVLLVLFFTLFAVLLIFFTQGYFVS